MKNYKILKKVLSVLLAITMVVSVINYTGKRSGKTFAGVTITSMSYYDSANGQTQSKNGVDGASFGVVMPLFNGKSSSEVSVEDVRADLELYVKQAKGTNGEWKLIESVPYFVFNDTWAWEKQKWSETASGWILWCKVKETTEFKFHGKANNVDITYTFNYTELEKQKLTSISTTETSIKASATGEAATHWGQWKFNGGVKYDQVKDDIVIKVDNNDGKGFVNLLANSSSGFIWDTNFGYYSDGDGGYWFTKIDHSFTLRFTSKSDPNVHVDVNVSYSEVDRSNYVLSSYDGKTTLPSDESGAVGIVLPKIGGTEVYKSDLDKFTYEIMVNGNWVSLKDVGESGWVYQGAGHNANSISSQWGYFADGVYGLWFQPVKKDTQIRISYPEDGKLGGKVNNNSVIYTLTKNDKLVINKPADMSNITISDNSSAFTPNGWTMIFNDEFEGNTIDTNKWNLVEGFLLEEDDINTAGWGNQELEFYSKNNASVADGILDINMKKESKVFYQKGDSSKAATASYSSAKLTTQNKFSVKYGRVDVRAKLPTGTALWPAIWMLPNDNLYGAWAYSGELDIAEGRGRFPNTIFGAIHYGGGWPNNLSTTDLMDLTVDGAKKTGINDWHVYSTVWDAESIKLYCDGVCFFKCTYDKWKSNSDLGNPYAPFDQRFYLILNFAIGGGFDEYRRPDASFTGDDMYVDYVRVYQKNVASSVDEKPDTNPSFVTDGVDDNLYGDYKYGSKINNETPTTPNIPATTAPSTQKPPVVTQPATTKKPATIPTIKSATKKKKQAKLSVKLKAKIASVTGYEIRVFKTKKNAKKVKKAIVTKEIKKNVIKLSVKASKLKKVKKAFVRVRTITVFPNMKMCGKWSAVKKVKIK